MPDTSLPEPRDSKIPISDLLRALGDFRRTWPQLVLCHLLSASIMVVVVGPMIGGLLLIFLAREEDGVLTDTEIATYLLDPVALAAGLLVVAVSIGVSFARFSLLLVIGFGAIENRRVTYVDAFRYVLRRARRFGRLATHIVLRIALVALPFLAAIAGVYLWLLSAYDINYYLTTRPPEFRRAAALAAVILAIGAVFVVRLLVGWILALPMVLFEDMGALPAMRRSWEETATRRRKILGLFVSWFALMFALSTAISFLVGLVGGRLIPDMGAPIAFVVIGLGLTLLLSGVVGLASQFVATSLAPLAIVRLYRVISGPGALTPVIAEAGSLGDRPTLRAPGRPVLIVAVIAPLAVLAGAYVAVSKVGSHRPAIVIAHRGASAHAPENTMAAFEIAFELADEVELESTDVMRPIWIELDVQENADDEVVVAHDSDFMKQAGRDLKVWDATSAELRTLDIGSWFGDTFEDERVPMLREVLAAAKGRAGVVIELKYYGHDRELEQRVVDIVEEAEMVGDVMIMSLKRPGLREFAALRPDWDRGLLNTASIGDLTRLDVDFLALNAAAATSAQIRRAHARDMRVFVWTINDPLRMSVMLSRGVDGIITDDPALARRVIELREDMSAVGRMILWAAGETGLLPALEEASSASDA